MKGLVVRAFTDKAEAFVYRKVGDTIECSDSRIKELVKLGYVKIVSEAKPEIEEPVKKPRTRKTTTKKKK